MTTLLVLPVVLPLLASSLCILTGSSRAAQRVIGLTTLTALVPVTIAILVRVDTQGAIVVQAGGWPAPIGITLIADRLSAIMLVTASVVLLAVLVYAIGQPGAERNHVGFQSTYMILAAGVAASFLTGDLFTLFVAIEMMLTASYVLLTLGGHLEQVRAGMTYVVVSLIASILFLVTLALVYASTGTMNMADLGDRIAALPGGLRAALAGLLLVVFGIKAALAPLYFWLPDAYPTAPSAVTAILAGLLTKVGLYAIIRTQTLLFPPDHRMGTILLVAAGATMVVGVLGALAQQDVRRVLLLLHREPDRLHRHGPRPVHARRVGGGRVRDRPPHRRQDDAVPRRWPRRAHRRLEPSAAPRRARCGRPGGRRAVPAAGAQPGGDPAVLGVPGQARPVRRHGPLPPVADPRHRRDRQHADAVLAVQDLGRAVLGATAGDGRAGAGPADPVPDAGADRRARRR